MEDKTSTIKKLVVVEDDADDQYFLQTAFKEIGFDQHVLYLDSAKKLFEYLKKENREQTYPSAILVDYNMPVMNGEETLTKLRQNKNYSGIQIMIYSTSITDTQVKTLENLGAEGCYTKSFSASGIVDFAKQVHQKIAKAMFQ